MSLFDFNTVAGEYDQFYESDYGKRIDFYEKQAVARQITPGDGWEALEIGCGTGHWSSFFREFGYSVTAIDLSGKMIEEANRKNLDGVRFLQADARELPFEKNTFDHLFTIATLEFIKERDAVVKEIKRVLKPGGWILAGCLNRDSALHEAKDEDPVLKHGRFFKPQELTRLLSEFGNPDIRGAVLPDGDGTLLDSTAGDDELRRRGFFLAGSVKYHI